jgi:hypothetical protein
MNNNRKKLICIRISDQEKNIIEKIRKEYGFNSISDYLRFVGLNTKITLEANK